MTDWAWALIDHVGVGRNRASVGRFFDGLHDRGAKGAEVSRLTHSRGGHETGFGASVAWPAVLALAEVGAIEFVIESANRAFNSFLLAFRAVATLRTVTDVIAQAGRGADEAGRA